MGAQYRFGWKRKAADLNEAVTLDVFHHDPAVFITPLRHRARTFHCGSPYMTKL
jgi:hypothetical protein